MILNVFSSRFNSKFFDLILSIVAKTGSWEYNFFSNSKIDFRVPWSSISTPFDEFFTNPLSCKKDASLYINGRNPTP